MEISCSKLSKLLFLLWKSLRVLHDCFFRCFHFTTDFYYCFPGVFTSPIFFTIAVFLSSTSFLCSCTVSARDLRELFLFSGVFYLTPLSTFGTIYFYQGFPGSQQFFPRDCRASHWRSKHRPCPCVCLNHTVFSKSY